MAKNTTICFTGHRAKGLCGYDINSYQGFVMALANKLRSFYNGSQLTFISGGAQGFDQLAFWAVDLVKKTLPENEKNNIKNIVYVPFKGQESRWLDKGLFSKTDYKNMLNAADEVKYLQDRIPDSTRLVGALMDRNHKMVDASDKVIALYEDDNWDTASGGTSECMRYANAHGKSIMQIKYTTDHHTLAFDEKDITIISANNSPRQRTVQHEEQGFEI